MKKALLLTAVVIGILVFGILGLTLFLQWRFPPPKLAEIAGEQARRHLNRELRFDAVSVGLFRGLRLDGFTLSEPPNLQAGTFISGKSLSVKPRLWPLLRGDLVLKSLTLEKPDIRLIRFADGSYNYSDLLSSGTAPAVVPAPGSVPRSEAAPSLFIQQLDVRKADIRFVDKSSAAVNLSMTDMDLSVSGFSLTTPGRIRLAGRLNGSLSGKPFEAQVLLRGTLLPSPNGSLELDEFRLKTGKTTVSAGGRITDFHSPSIDLRLHPEPLRAQDLVPFFSMPIGLSDMDLRGELHLNGNLEKMSIRGDLSLRGAGLTAAVAPDLSLTDPLKKIGFAGVLAVSNLSAQKSPLFPDLSLTGPLQGKVEARGTLKQATMSFHFTGDRATFRYASLVKKRENAPLRLDGKITIKDPVGGSPLDVRGEFGGLELPTSAPPLPADLRLSGPLSAKINVGGTLDRPSFRFQLLADEAAVSYAGYFQKPSGKPLALLADVRLSDRKNLLLKNFQLSMESLSLTGHGNISDLPGTADMGLSFKIPPVSLESLSPAVPLIKEYGLSGRTSLDLQLAGTLAAPRISGSLTLKNFGAVPKAGLVFSEFEGDVAFSMDSMETSLLKGRFNGEPLLVRSQLKNFSKPELWCEGELATLDAGKLQKVFSETSSSAVPVRPAGAPAATEPALSLAKAEGHFKIETLSHPNYIGRRFRLAWNLTEVDSEMLHWNGTAELSADDGKIYNLPLAVKINKILKKDAADLTYSRLSSHFQMKDGLLETRDFMIDSSQMDIAVRGTLKLSTLLADLRATFKLPMESALGTVGDWVIGEDGALTLEAVIKGPLTDPAVAVDLDSAARQAAQNLLKKGVERLKDSLQSPQDKDQKPSLPVQGEKQILKTIEQGQKALDKLFKKK
ncbi:MAG TPA: AsmA-like C-terminal region-containing protein [Elusimicrobiota bacterium]|nr:AsmA-like C-terminal region-containing protein [Elusimicrobiota bacterium]